MVKRGPDPVVNNSTVVSRTLPETATRIPLLNYTSEYAPIEFFVGE